jgi:hypothetical protein
MVVEAGTEARGAGAVSSTAQGRAGVGGEDGRREAESGTVLGVGHNSGRHQSRGR